MDEPPLVRALRGRDLAVGYALVVLVLAAVLAVQPASVRDDLVLRCSTNVANLRDRPLSVLVTSAFVLPSVTGLWVLPLLVAAYGAAQRWLGRLATVLVAVFGHVFATLSVAVLISAGITHHALDRSAAREPDVGVSYGLVAVLALLVLRLPRAARRAVGLGGVAFLGGLVAVDRSTTDVGHLLAWLIGLTMGAVGDAVGRAALSRASAGAGAPRGGAVPAGASAPGAGRPDGAR